MKKTLVIILCMILMLSGIWSALLFSTSAESSATLVPKITISFDDCESGDHLTYIESMPTEGSTPNYPEGGKWGIVSNNGYITYTDVTNSKSKVANTYTETIYKADGTSALQTEHQGRKVSGWTHENNLTVSNAKAYSGNNSFEIKSADMAYATGFNIPKAGKYAITYYINNLDAIKTASNLSTGTNFGSAVLSTINIGVNRTGSDVYYTDSKIATVTAQLPNHLKFPYSGAFVDYTFSKINSASDFKNAALSNDETWYKVTHTFETKEAHQKVYFAIYNNTGSVVCIDDIVLAEFVEPEPEPEPTPDPEGTISFDNFESGDHLSYVEATPAEGNAPKYPENGKWGIVSNNGYITYTDVTNSKSKVANTYAETLYKADGTSALQTEHQGRKVSGWTHENNLTVSNAKAYSGNNSFEIKSADMAYATGFNIPKAGKYTITYYINNLDAIKTASNLSTGTNFGSAVLSTINIGVNRTGSDVYYTDSAKSSTISAQLPNHLKFAFAAPFVDYTFSKINSATDFKNATLSNDETWYKVTHTFETKEAHQKVYFAIYNNTGSVVCIDDIVLAEFVEPELEPEPTPDPEGTISFDNFESGDHLSYVEATPAEGNAPKYPENGKWGIVSNNGYITYTDVTNSKSKVANTYAETIYKADGTSALQTEHQGRKVSGWTHENNLTVSTAKAHSGNNSFEIKSADMAYATGFNIPKAGKYAITYYINNLDAIKAASNLSTGTNFGSAVLSTINIGANRTGSDVYYTDSTKSATISAQLPNHLKFAFAAPFVDYTFSKINSAIDFKDAELSNGETWYKVTHAFETKEAHQKVYFAIYNNTGENVYIDDIVLSEVIETEPGPEPSESEAEKWQIYLKNTHSEIDGTATNHNGWQSVSDNTNPSFNYNGIQSVKIYGNTATFAKLLEGLEVDKSYKVSFKYFMPETSVPAGSGDSLFYQTGIVSRDTTLTNGYPSAPLKIGEPCLGKKGEWQEYSITFTNWDSKEKFFYYIANYTAGFTVYFADFKVEEVELDNPGIRPFYGWGDEPREEYLINFDDFVVPFSETVVEVVDNGPARDGKTSNTMHILPFTSSSSVFPRYWDVKDYKDPIFTLNVKPNTLYEFSFWIYIHEKAGNISWLQFYYDFSGADSFILLNGTKDKGRWVKYSAKFATKADQTKISMGVNLGQSAEEMWIDDFSIKEVPAGVLADDNERSYCIDDHNLIIKNNIFDAIEDGKSGIYKINVTPSVLYTFGISANSSKNSKSRIFLSYDGVNPIPASDKDAKIAEIKSLKQNKRYCINFVSNSKGELYLVVENSDNALTFSEPALFKIYTLSTGRFAGSEHPIPRSLSVNEEIKELEIISGEELVMQEDGTYEPDFEDHETPATGDTSAPIMILLITFAVATILMVLTKKGGEQA